MSERTLLTFRHQYPSWSNNHHARVISTTVDLDNFETSGTHTILGNIFDGSDATGMMVQNNTVNSRLSISG